MKNKDYIKIKFSDSGMESSPSMKIVEGMMDFSFEERLTTELALESLEGL